MKFNLLLPALGLCVLIASARAEDKPFYLKDGDRVVFYGDSITDQRLYTTFTETYVLTRFPKLDVTFVHSGWGGDRVSGGGGGAIDNRLKRDVFAYDPTVMTIMLGMNDGAYRAFDQEIFDRYSSGFEHILDSVKQTLPNIRITLVQPSPFDDVTQPPRFEGGYNQVLVRYGQFLKELAERRHLDLADLNSPVVAALEKAKATDPELAKKIIPDRVHPGAAGHLLMAAELLKAWHAPRLVSTLELDARNQTVVHSQACLASELRTTPELSWTQLDAALPLPVDTNDTVMALAVGASDLVDTLNRQDLKVTGLKSERYALMIDSTAVGEFTREQLATGINLAMLATPMQKQAAEVHRLTLQHNNLHFTRWRQIQVPMATFDSERVQVATKELMAALDSEEKALIARQHAAAQPVEHHYKLIPR